ncbi:MerC domain-containing protein [Mucilaginibacter achroorhodeus]|uniref:MerC domain-containing protein n=1 Tax=Mucilaginibacter achroorhodeus TaxID=2599294 RepID=A0A563U2J9_9SPHI|nr:MULTISPECIES: MerC domain-containing protein [Mucilaginibacter]QXV64121.1 MerC domain-containing protein [Mucilaginibacter sp. 21P]TWR25571.1 MerC domain-containing protein [Mucilaginibacter achroorhodeus]
MLSPRKALKLDNIGMTASTLCAIHCAAVPVFFTSLPLLGLEFLANPWVEWSMILFALFIGVWSIGGEYKNHRNALPLAMLVLGFILVIGGHLLIHNWVEAVVVPVGGLLIATAHFINYKLAGTCNAGNSFLHLKHSHKHDNKQAA